MLFRRNPTVALGSPFLCLQIWSRASAAWCDTIELHASYDPLLFRLMAEKDKLEMKLNIQGEKKDD